MVQRRWQDARRVSGTDVEAFTVKRSEIMRKQELIPIHALLLQVAQYLIENENMPAESMSTYHALDVRPSSIHKSKQDHYDAITALGNAIEWWIGQTHSSNLEYPAN